MLKDRNSSAIVAVSDLERARAFYEDTLGLAREPGGEEECTLGFRTGDTHLTVYKSEFAGTNKANAVTWRMKGDLVETVKDLKTKGVTFERYDFPGMEWRDGVHEAGPVKLAWFRDPDGNFLHLIEGM
ncbi:VOC family protein [Brevundimonas sp.]|uniref:VOC family protein n=1 Tax=Brevundimonas sp. TaxID=1871086 RepID=UPI002D5DA16E|nr:VOC family protein [Brevundimonas sp.]HYC98468.1 VOC family protein [Brevundimonas sp.]